jgi:hypothetical protein
MGASGLECANLLWEADEPLKKVNRVDTLIHEGSTSVELEGAFPCGGGIVFGGSPPLDVSRAKGERSESAREDGILDDSCGTAESVLENPSEETASLFFGGENGVNGL